MEGVVKISSRGDSAESGKGKRDGRRKGGKDSDTYRAGSKHPASEKDDDEGRKSSTEKIRSAKAAKLPDGGSKLGGKVEAPENAPKTKPGEGNEKTEGDPPEKDEIGLYYISSAEVATFNTNDDNRKSEDDGEGNESDMYDAPEVKPYVVSNDCRDIVVDEKSDNELEDTESDLADDDSTSLDESESEMELDFEEEMHIRKMMEKSRMDESDESVNSFVQFWSRCLRCFQ